MGTADDKLEIMELMARYALCIDGGDAAGFADVFTDDGSADFRPDEDRRITANGRQAMLAFVGQSMERRGQIQIRHHTGCPIFTELTPERAITRTYCYASRIARQPGITPPPAATGIYYDEFVRTPKGWRFKSRKFIGDPQPQPES